MTVDDETLDADRSRDADATTGADARRHIARLSELATERHLRVGVAESLTSGLLANTVGAGDDASEWFAGGVVAYLTDVKERVLGMIPGTDPCSAACAEQLAAGARRLFDADLAVSTTGVGGPDPQGGHPAGTVYLGWATADDVGHRRLALVGGPEEVLVAAVEAAVRLLAFHAESRRTVGPRRGRGGEG
ncbi:CinA family protein [Microbacterium sp. MYb62]|uniref:CinA family protein n=1 Tax=Microbacterium sp. MYb62 TaxID=1848690 RepID=UPI000CFDF437|nr:CinA family protein [Microbacterium sp. MYb62]PRB10636.1 damage-inducible protein CinA [Microbacterium sp. MYb62]